MAKNFPLVSWAIGANIYEVNIRQYTPEGNFVAFAKHLPRLKDMGVKILWLMPITPISIAKRQGSLGSYYACSSYTKINTEFGSIDDFKQLVTTAHSLGFKVIIDWVANHTGYDHHWTKEHPEFYLKDKDGNFTEKNGWQDVIDLDYSNDALQDAMIAAMQFWITTCQIDGFRCDMAHLVPLSFWQKARQACDEIKKLFWLAECDEKEYHQVFDVSYAWQWMHATEKYFKNEIEYNEVNKVLLAYSSYSSGNDKLFFTSNHDENSWNGTEYEKYGKAAKAMAVFTFTWQGIPLIYSGQENCNQKRLLFFDKDEIVWNNPPTLYQFYKTLLCLHTTNALAVGETVFITSNFKNVVIFFRRYKEEVVLVLLNFSEENKLKINIEHDCLKGNFYNVFTGINFDFSKNEQFELQGFEYRVYTNTPLIQ